MEHIFTHMVGMILETAWQVASGMAWRLQLVGQCCQCGHQWQVGGAGCSDRCIDLTAAAATSLFTPITPQMTENWRWRL